MGRIVSSGETLAHVATVSFGNKSLTLPPATLKNAELTNPPKNRKIRKTARIIVSHVTGKIVGAEIPIPMFGAKATGNESTKNIEYDTQ